MPSFFIDFNQSTVFLFFARKTKMTDTSKRRSHPGSSRKVRKESQRITHN